MLHYIELERDQCSFLMYAFGKGIPSDADIKVSQKLRIAPKKIFVYLMPHTLISYSS